MKKLFLIYALCLGVFAGNSQENTSFKLSKKIPLNGDGKWDYMSVDNTRNRLYVSHADRVHVIDLVSDKAIAEWTGLANVHGISFSKKENKVYVANTSENNLVIFDANSLKKIKTVELKGAQKPDCVLFDEFSQKAFVFCGKSNNTYVLDAKSDEIISIIDMGGKPEFACSDENGFVYNNIEDKNEVVVIDAKLNKIVNRFSLLENKAPTGIAIDKKNERLMVACEESEKMVVLDMNSGRLISAIPMGKKTDGLVYIKGKNLIITSNGSGSATVIKQEGADKYLLLQTVETQLGLKTISYEEKKLRFFVSGASFEPDGKTIIPNTFSVFVYSIN
jgi:DNA-binding beta-propeller fold protein YncE